MLVEWARIRQQRKRDRRRRDVQLRLREARDPDREPGVPRDGQPGEHVSGPDGGRPGTEAGEPDNYYPSGTRNYARVVWNDQFQGAANAQYAKELGLKKIFILNDGETYGLGIATLFAEYAEKLGIQILGNQKWDKKASSYESLASRISSSGADAVFLGGIVCNNGGKLIKDIKAGAPNVQLLGPDGWTPISATIEGAGEAANDMYITQPGVPVEELKGAGKEFVDGFTEAAARPRTRIRRTPRRRPRCCSMQSRRAVPIGRRSRPRSSRPTSTGGIIW